MNFLISKNMPENAKKKLSYLGTVFEATECNISDKSIAGHPDLQIHFVSENTAFCPKELYGYFKRTLPEYIDLFCGKSNLKGTYPDCCAYNIARINKTVICNERYADIHILDYYCKHNFRIINVNQGYTKCNICYLPDASVLTEDDGIYRQLLKNNIQVCKIDVGDVRLDGYEYGFIGGATGLFDNKILYSGKISKQLFDFNKKHGFEYIELCDDELTDFGSILTF